MQRRRLRPISTINVTPFVDVLLVLLVVFMITASILAAGVRVDLPKSGASELKGEQSITLSMNAQGHVFIQDMPVAPENLATQLRILAKDRFNQRIYIRGDQNLSYGQIMQIMGILDRAGFHRVALVTKATPNTRDHEP